MATVLGDLLVRLGLDATSLTAALNSVNKELDKAAKDVQRNFSGIQKSADNLKGLGTTLSVGLTLPIVGLGAAALNSAADMEALKLALSSVAGTAEETEKQFKQLVEVAKLPGLGLKDAVQASVNLQVVGFSAEKARKTVTEFGNALAAVGRGREDLGELVRQFGQLQNNFNAANLRPIMERIPQVAAIIKRVFGPGFLSDPAEEFKKLGISAAKFSDILLTEMSKASRVAGGVKNDLTNMSDAIDQSLGKVGASLIPIVKVLVNEAVPAVEGLAKAFTGLSPETQKFIIISAGFAAVLGPAMIILGQMVTTLIQLRLGYALTMAALDKLAISLATTKVGLLGWVGIVLEAVKAAYDIARALWEWHDAEVNLKAAQDARSETNNELARRILASKRATQQQRAEVIQLNEALSRGEIDQELYGLGLRDIANAIGNTIPKQKEAAAYTKAHGEMSKEAARAIDEYQQAIEKQAESVSAALRDSKSFVDTFRLLASVQGPITEEQYKLAKSIDETAEKLKTATKATQAYLDAVASATMAKWRKDSEKQIEITRELTAMEKEGALVVRERTLEQIRGAEDVKRAQDAIRGAIKLSTKEQKQGIKEVSTVINDMIRDTARAIIQWEGFGAMMKRIGESIAEGVLRLLITKIVEATGAVAALEKVFEKLGKKVDVIIDGIIGALGKVFGKKGTIDAAGSLVSGLFPDSGGGGGGFPGFPGMGGGAGAAAGAAVSGVMGIVGAVGSVASAISGIIGNFQMKGMNNSLGLIEESTRYASIHLEYILEKLNEYIPWLKDLSWLGTIDVRLMAILGVAEESRELLRGIGSSVASATSTSWAPAAAPAGAGGLEGGLTVNVYGMVMGSGGISELTDKIMADLRKRGAIK